MTGALTSIAGTATAPGIKFSGSTQAGFYRSAADQISASTAGVERLRIKADGTIRGASDVALWAQLGASTDVAAMLAAADYAAILTLLQVMTTAATNAAIAAAVSSAIPIGMMGYWPANTPPTNWLERDGTAISRTTYDDLFAVIGTTYGAGDGSTTFNLPNDLGYFERAWDHGAGVDPGRVFGSIQADELKSHTHTVYGVIAGAGTGGLRALSTVSGSGDTTSAPTGGTETRPKNRAYLPIIKAL